MSGLHEFTRMVQSPDGIALHVRVWKPAQVRRVILLIHGGLEHAARYQHVARELGARGGMVIGADHRGHGRSSGPRGHVDSFTRYTADLRLVVDEVARDEPAHRPGSVPWFVFGHSMGGLVGV